MNLKLIAILLAVVAVSFGVVEIRHRAYKQGYSEAETKYKAEITKANMEALEVLNTKNDEIKNQQKQINDFHMDLIQKRLDLQNANREKDRITAQYRDGIKRMSIAANCKSDPAGQSESARPAELSNQGRCELLPKTAGTILDLARGYQEGVRKLNECIDRYNNIKDSVNR